MGDTDCQRTVNDLVGHVAVAEIVKEQSMTWCGHVAVAEIVKEQSMTWWGHVVGTRLSKGHQ